MGEGAENRFKGEIEEIREQIRVLTKRLDSLVLAAEAESNAGESGEVAANDSAGEVANVFLPGDPRLKGLDARNFARWIFPDAVNGGRLSKEDMKFLRLWQSGSYFQSAPLPILFPFDEDVADIAAKRISPRISYFNDVVVTYEGVKYRLLAGYWLDKALPAMLNWFLKRGYSEDELLAKGRDLPLRAAEKEIDFFSDLPAKARRNWVKPKPVEEPAPKPKKLTRREAALAAERMAAVRRFPDGSIAAKDIKTALLRQIRLHHYTPRQFSAGIDLDTKIVMKWCKGELVIRPDELKTICRHLGVRNLFEGL